MTSQKYYAAMGHFSAPEFYHSLSPSPVDGGSTNSQDANADTDSSGASASRKKSLIKYTLTTVAGFSIVALINALTLTFGFLTFGGNCQGNILNNYAATDVGAALSRFLVTLSVAGGYPFLLAACRASAMEVFFERSAKNTERKVERKVTATLLTALTVIALAIKDAGFVVAFNGALMGGAIIYVFPALLFLRKTAISHDFVKPATKWKRLILKAERSFCRFLTVFGMLLSVIGAAVAVMSSYFPHLLL